MDITLDQADNLNRAILAIAFCSNYSTEHNLAASDEALLAVFAILGVSSIDGKTIEEYKKEEGAE
jgi:hypothetical protein